MELILLVKLKIKETLHIRMHNSQRVNLSNQQLMLLKQEFYYIKIIKNLYNILKKNFKSNIVLVIRIKVREIYHLIYKIDRLYLQKYIVITVLIIIILILNKNLQSITKLALSLHLKKKIILQLYLTSHLYSQKENKNPVTV